jgi:hypothetical protein
MSDTHGPLNVEGNTPPSTVWKPRHFGNSISAEMRKFYALQAVDTKHKIDHLGAEINQRQDKMRLINDIISEINSLTDEKNGLDISQNVKLLEKLLVAKELGVHMKDGQFKFNAIERDRLIENLHLSADSWDKENRHQTQKMEIHVKELDRLMMLLKDVDRKEDQALRPMVSGIRAGGQ